MNDIVYRIQDADGRGPWRPGFSHKWVEDRTDDEFLALVPWTLQFDTRKIVREHLVGMHLGCGCLTLEQMQRWFRPSEYETLLRYGYRAIRMDDVRVLAQSDIQCVFLRAKPLNKDVVGVELYAAKEA